MIVLDLHTYTPVPTDTLPPVVLCLGNFDGVHRGHAALIEATRCQAESLRRKIPEVCTGAWCFAVPPRRYLGGEISWQITSLREKLELMASLGLDYVYLGDFHALRTLTPQQFIEDVLRRDCRCVATVCGFNHRFGQGGAGRSSDLEHAFGDCARIVPPVSDPGRGVVISSSRIRTLLLEGEMEEAVHLLGHPFLLRAPVVHGKALGRTIGLPTINQYFPAGHLVPAHGIYATRLTVDGQSYIGVTNVGKRPTVEQSNRVNCETHILDFNASLYGRTITVEFYHKLRDEKKFEGLPQLIEAIRNDAVNARAYFADRRGGDA